MPPPLIGGSLSDDAVCRVRTDPGKVWKVMEFKVEIFQVWKIMENDVRYGKVKSHGKCDC